MAAPIKRDNKGRIVKGTGGRPHGSTNHLTKTVKSTVLTVFNQLQKDPKHNLLKFAKRYPRDFYQIAAKLIPQEVNARVGLAISKKPIVFS